MQRSLTNQVIGNLERSTTDLASRLARQPIIFVRTAEAKHQCKVALENIMLAKFNDTAELENVTSQTQINIDRMAKRRAMCDIG
jgi:ubiquinone biosynthesis protein UbiJ